MTTSHQAALWTDSRPPVLRGARPARVVTLADMADPDRHGTILPLVSAGHRNRRHTGVVLLRFAADAAIVALIEPYVLHGAHLVTEPEQLGIVLEDGRVANVWLGAAKASPPMPPQEIGAHYARLLDPVAAAAGITCQLGVRRGAHTIVDAIALRGARLQRQPAGRADLPTDWIHQMQSGTGHELPKPLRGVTAFRASATPIELLVPRGCCAGTRTPPQDACPACPLRPDDSDRRTAAEEWISHLAPSDLRYLIGTEVSPSDEPG